VSNDVSTPTHPDDDAVPAQTADERSGSRVRRVVGHLAADVTVATVWAVLIVAIVLFSGVVSQFAYVDF